jgi:D-glycero-D-manno-heptose 1,7-bisphosphate phosphatase
MTKKQYILYIFDLDGTLVETKSGALFRKTPDDWQLLPGRREKLIELKARGARLAIATNQGGVAFGYFSQEAILREIQAAARALGISPAGVYICYTHPKASIEQYRAEDDRRKPGPGMLKEAMMDFDAMEVETLMIGDRPEDEQAARNAGVEYKDAREFFAS